MLEPPPEEYWEHLPTPVGKQRTTLRGPRHLGPTPRIGLA